MENKLNQIITEEISNIFEVINYSDSDIINPNEIDLYGEYNKLNKQLFNNQLPEVPMKWGARKGSLGHVNAMVNRRTGESKVNHLTISAFHSLPYKTFKNTLAHEMIHVKQLTDGSHYMAASPHGFKFQQEANRINQMGLGFNITTKSDEDLGVSDNVKKNTKRMIGIVLKIDNKLFACTTTPNVFNSEFENVIKLFQKLVNNGKYRNVEILVVDTNNGDLLKTPMKRTFRNGISYAPISNELLSELLKDHIIMHKNLTRDMALTEENQNDDWEEIIVT